MYIYNSLLVLKYLAFAGTKMSLVLRTLGTESALAKHLLAAFTKHAATLLCEHDSDGGPAAADLRRDSVYRLVFFGSQSRSKICDGGPAAADLRRDSAYRLFFPFQGDALRTSIKPLLAIKALLRPY
jgi:hypothetical protein